MRTAVLTVVAMLGGATGLVGCGMGEVGCSNCDGGARMDAGHAVDAGSDAGPGIADADAGPSDAGLPDVDAGGHPDAGHPDAGHSTDAGACVQESTSILNSASGNLYAWTAFGNDSVAFDDWGPDMGLSQWINDATCWGVTTTSHTEINNIASYANVSRGWVHNSGFLQQRSTSGYPTAPNWTTLSGMGVQNSAITKCHVKWSVTTPTTPNANDAVSRWDALIDIYFHTVANPSTTAWLPQIDLQIMQTLMDQPLGGQAANAAGYYAYVFANHHAWFKTIGGVPYVGVIDIATYNQPGGHTITLIPRPTMFSDPTTTGLLWGQASVVHDVGAIIAWLGQSNPKDDNGNPIQMANGTVVTSPVIAPSLYLTAINAGFEIDFGTAPNDNTWVTHNFWVAMQNEPDGP